MQELEPAEQRAQLLLFRLLAQGAPVPPARLAAATGIDEGQVTRWLARWHGVQTSDGLSRVMDPGVEWLWHEPGEWDCHDACAAA